MTAAADRRTILKRYLAAFGPASAADVSTWSGWSGVREVIDELRPELIVLRDENGRELFDLPDAPRPDEQTLAPVRFLPEYDNLLLSHSDRSHVGPAHLAGRFVGFVGNFLVDGFARGQWRVAATKAEATLEVEAYAPLTSAEEAEVGAEAEALLRWHEPRAATHRVVFGPLSRAGTRPLRRVSRED